MRKVIVVPPKLRAYDLNNSIENWEADLAECQSGGEVLFDFRKSEFITPPAVVYLQATKDRLNEKGVKTWWQRSRFDRLNEFLFNIGLVQRREQDLDNISFGSKYAVKISRCYTYNECLEVQKEIMKRISSRIKCVDSTKAALDYMITELWDNAGTHGYKCYDGQQSYPKPIYICAFEYQSCVEIAILDRGQGVVRSLRHNPKNANIGFKDLMRRAVQEGVSGHPKKSPGFGLYSAVELARSNGGKFFMWSSKQVLQVDNGKPIVRKGFLSEGTLVSVTLNASLETSFQEIVASYDSAEEYLELMEV